MWLSELLKKMYVKIVNKKTKVLFTIIARHPDGNLNELRPDCRCVGCSLEDFGKGWLNYEHCMPYRVQVMAKTPEEAIRILKNNLLVYYAGKGEPTVCAMRYALFVVYLNDKFLNYYYLFK